MRERSTSSTILILLVLLITFPIWIAVGGIFLGIIGGLIGALFGVIGALFGVLMTLIALPFKLLVGHGWLEDGIFHFNNHTWTIVAVVLIVALLVRRQRTTN